MPNDPELQAIVTKMTAWQRNQWARAGYPSDHAKAKAFLLLKRRA